MGRDGAFPSSLGPFCGKMAGSFSWVPHGSSSWSSPTPVNRVYLQMVWSSREDAYRSGGCLAGVLERPTKTRGERCRPVLLFS